MESGREQGGRSPLEQIKNGEIMIGQMQESVLEGLSPTERVEHIAEAIVHKLRRIAEMPGVNAAGLLPQVDNEMEQARFEISPKEQEAVRAYVKNTFWPDEA